MQNNVFTECQFDFIPDDSCVAQLQSITHKNSHRRCSGKKSVLKNFSNFTGKRLCWSLLFNKVADLKSAN